MNKKITKLIAAIALLTFLIPFTGWGQTRTEVTDVMNQSWTGVTGTSYTEKTDLAGSASDAVYTVQCAGGNNSIQLRSNNNNSGIVSTTSGGTVTKVTVTWNTNTQSGRTLNVYGKSSAYSAASDLYGNNAGTLIGTIVCGTSTELEIDDDYEYIGMRSASGAMYHDEIDVTWETGGGTPAPSFTISNNNEIAYNAANGSFDFTLNNPVTGGNLDISEDVDWIDEATINGNATDGYSASFTTTTNTAATSRQGVITLTYTYNTNQTVTKEVTVTQAGNPNAINNISEVTYNSAYTVKGTVVATNTKGFIIGDGTGYVYTYLNAAPSYSVGDIVKISGTTGQYGHVIQFTSSATFTTETTSNYDGTPDVTVITAVPDYSEGYHLSSYLQFEGTLTKPSSYYLVAVGSSSIRIAYPTSDQTAELDNLLNKTVRVHGFFSGISGSGSNAVFTATMESVEEVISSTPTIYVAPISLSGFTYEEGNGPSTAKMTYVSGNALTEDISLSLGDNSDFEMSTTEGSGYTNSLTLTQTAGTVDATTIYVRLKAGLAVNDSYSGTITLTSTGATSGSVSLSGSVTAYMAPYATLPFAFDGGRADIATTAGLTHDGLDSDYASSPKLKFNSTDDYVILQINERPGTLSFDIKGNSFSGGTFKVQTSEDGSTYSDLGTYTAFGSSGNEKFDDEEYTNLGENVRYIKWIYTDKSNGNVALGDIHLAVYVAPSTNPTITVAPATVDNVVAAGDDGTLALTYANLTITQADDFGIQFYDDNDQELNGSNEPDWIAVIVEDGTNSGEYQVSYIVGANNGVERTAYFKVFASDGTDFVYSNLVTITQEEYVAPVPSTTYTLVTSIVSGKRYIITNGTNKAMGAQSTNNRAAVDVNIDAGVATVSSDDVYEFVIIGPDVDSLYTIYDVSNEKYLNAAGTGSSNYLKLQDPITDRGLWTITFSNDAAVITAKTTATDRKNMRYNNGSTCFSCYGTGQQPIYLFAKDNETTSTITKNIDAYTDERDHYYLIASPFGQVTPTTGNNFLVNNYDLYAFNQAEDDEWRNYKAESFNLISGRGYLYANSADVELAFEGMPYVGNGQVMLAYADGKEFAGWNLIGNPYNDNATVSDTLAYYTLNSDGSELAAVAAGSGNSVGAMEGIFVKVDKANQSVKFTKATAKGNTERNTNLVLSLNGNNGNVIDRTIVRFDEGQTLPKFMLNPQNTKLYIPQSGKDYAVVRSEGQGEMPLNFKAAKNGTYTLSVEAENLGMDYLHLIDNLTGANIDLLATPSYTFTAKTTDYASRFRLVFSMNGVIEENVNETFAYINGDEIVITNADAKTSLQVVDMMGRVLVSTKGTNSLSTAGLTQGVYVIRLFNGENVKTQKIVIQ